MQDVLFWPPDRRAAAFRAMEDVAPTRRIAASGAVKPLSPGKPLAFGDPGDEVIGKDFDAFMARQNMAGVIIMQDGKVRLERYANGFKPEDRWSSFSIAKSVTATLVGAALRDGAIKNLDDKVTRYLPGLAGSAYEDVTVRQLVTMTSGVRWDEDYTSRRSDVTRFLELRPRPGIDVAVDYMRRLKREATPGSRWHYSTGETTLLGLLVANATGKPLADYLSEKIWRPYGMERDAIWALDRNGREIGGCCISATLRDYARLGQFMLDGGIADGSPVLDSDWIARGTSLQPIADPRGVTYGYGWWLYRPGLYEARGIFGQSILVDPVRKLVVVVLSNWPNALGTGDYARRHTGFLIELLGAVDRETVRAQTRSSGQ